jgi:hypothetical protein
VLPFYVLVENRERGRGLSGLREDEKVTERKADTTVAGAMLQSAAMASRRQPLRAAILWATGEGKGKREAVATREIREGDRKGRRGHYQVV